MRNINKIILLGNLTRDPETKKTLGNQAITTFGLATNREWMTKDGRHQKEAEFHELVSFGRLAEISAQYLKKGKLVYIEGHLKTRSWDDTSGLKRFRTEIVIADLVLLDRRPKGLEEPAKGTLQESASTILQEQPSVSMEDPLAI